MATKEQADAAIAVIREIAGNPETGAVADLIDLIKNSATATNEVRVVEPKEKR